MSDGDTLEFEENMTYTLEDHLFIIKKDIHLVGYYELNEANNKVFLTTIKGNFIIDSANVSINGLWIEPDANRTAFWIKNEAELIIKDCHIVSKGESKQYGFYIDHSKVTIDTVYFDADEASAHSTYCKNESTYTLKNSNIPKISLYHSEAFIENSTLRGQKNNNTVNVKFSTITLSNSNVMAPDSESNFPCIWSNRSVINSSHSIIKQPLYTSCICLNDNSQFSSSSDTITSISVYESRVLLEETTINEILSISNKSYCYSKNQLLILGENPKKIEMLVEKQSLFYAEQVTLTRQFTPNIRIREHSIFRIDGLEFTPGSISEIKWDIDETSQSFVNTTDVNTTEPENKKVVSEDDFDASQELDNLTGLIRVKEEIDKMVKVVQVNNQRVAKGLPPIKQSLHSVFMGNPGTGKTTVARLMGQILFDKGALSGDSYIYVEASEKDLVSNHVGETAIQTTNVLESARGGVLFIDEAYTLNKKGGGTNWGQEAIDTILKYMEDHREEIMVIFAGYTKEMEEFLRTNPGLESRVPNKLHFDDYTEDEIIVIGKQLLEDGQYQLEDSAYYERMVGRSYKSSMDKSNARWIRNFNEQLTKSFALRVIEENSDDVATIKNIDIDHLLDKGKFREDDSTDPLGELNNLIGIQKVKEQVARFVDQAKVNKLREEQGFTNSSFTLHSLFMGNPGTGKTTVARLLGQALYQKDIIRTNKFIEVSRSDLVAGYSGQTAIKTREVLQSALGGVLFIDEAYSLYKDSHDSFGLEAIDEILKFMEDERDNIVIILAGYTREMTEFLQANSGLTSRIPNRFDFEDYSPEEISQIGTLQLLKNHYTFDKDQYKQLISEAYEQSNDRSNGRWVRNLNERLLGIMSSRIARGSYDNLFTITSEDMKMIREDDVK